MTNRWDFWLLALKPLIRLKLYNFNNFKKYKKGMFLMLNNLDEKQGLFTVTEPGNDYSGSQMKMSGEL